jgi:DNA polymerase III epsilon subunit-like protein
MNEQEKLNRIPAPGFDPTADWRTLPLAVIDFETSGLDPVKDRVVEYGIALFDDGIETCNVNSLINPEVKLSDEVIKIHGITNEMSQEKGVNITVALDSFFADGKTVDVLVAHNTQFDSDIIKMELLRIIEDKTRDHEAKDTYKDMLYHATYVFAFRCTMKETIDFCKIAVQGSYGKTYNKFPSLAELYYKLFQQKPENLHNALHDVLITLICFMKFNYLVNEPPRGKPRGIIKLNALTLGFDLTFEL